MTHYLIIGGGIAGTSAAEQLRKLDPQSEITILSDEKHPLYSRVLLPHYITGKTPRERVFLKKMDWYKEKNIHLAFEEVVTLNTAKQQIATATGAVYSYDKLLIAGGGIVNHLPFDENASAYHLQTIEDADRVKTLMDDNQEGALKAGIVGGGFIAMEFAELFAKKKWNSHLFLRGEQFFSRTFNQQASNLLEEHLANHGIKTYKNTTIASYTDGMVKTAQNGAFPIDALAAGIGINSSFSWAADGGINVGSGIKTNEFLETNIPTVWAAGDCAQYTDLIAGRELRAGNWMAAQMQGRHVAQNMTGEHEPFRLVSSYATHVLGIDIIAIGDAELAKAEQVLVRDYGDGITLLAIRDNKLVGASLINQNTDRAPITNLIKQEFNVSQKIQTLEDVTVNLKELL